MKELKMANRKITDLSEIEKNMLLQLGYDIVIEEDYLYIDFDLGVTLKIKVNDLMLEK